MDTSVIEAARTGDRGALEQLVTEYEVPIRLFAARLLPGHALAEDVAQEAFLTAFRNLESFDSSRDFGLWVRGIVRNLAMREWQRMSRKKAKMEDLAQHVEMLAEEGAEDVDQEDQIRVLRRCIEKLPEKSGQLLQMVYELGFSHSRIAEQIHSTLDAVKQGISRLRFRLKECMNRELTGMEV